MVPGPYKCKRMRVVVIPHGIHCTDPPTMPSGWTQGNRYILGTVEGMDIELIREGGIVPHYDSETGKHAVGTRHVTLRLRRWFKADLRQTDLIFDLMNSQVLFSLESQLTNVQGSTLTLSDCLIYTYRPVTGGANDIVSEEGRAECVDWNGTGIWDTDPIG